MYLDNKLDQSANTEVLYQTGQSRLHFLCRLRSFNVCRDLLYTFYKLVVESALQYAAGMAV